ncbi:MAG: hypothetical protein JSV96_00515 [Candidatus Aminicenantes bacterium]|nr:MAG: hypothetical protein JSV96_00515 [Candidatus Aminicenantes bacterium]
MILPTLGTAGLFDFYLPNLPMVDISTKSRHSNEDMSADMDKETVKEYVDEHFTGSYEIGEIEDHGTYYMTEISGSDGSVKDILVIDKQTNKIKSLK